MNCTEEKWIDRYKEKGALWIHSGKKQDPHALLTSGLHSSGYFNSRLVTEDSFLLREAAADLLENLELAGYKHQNIEVVAGPATGATKLAEAIAVQISAWLRSDISFISPTKQESELGRKMVLSDEDKQLVCDQVVLICEDVITTATSVMEVAKAVQSEGGLVIRAVVSLVNRSGLDELPNGYEIISLIDQPMPLWNPEKRGCPLCAMGSKAISPKDNWALLTGHKG
jgi:orotate phosphoribosyltransferase